MGLIRIFLFGLCIRGKTYFEMGLQVKQWKGNDYMITTIGLVNEL